MNNKVILTFKNEHGYELGVGTYILLHVMCFESRKAQLTFKFSQQNSLKLTFKQKKLVKLR